MHSVSRENISLGVNGINPNTTPFGGFIMEMLMTMLLVLVVYSTAVDKGNNSSPMLPPLLIGLTVTVAHLVCIPYTGDTNIKILFFQISKWLLGTSINPARSFGPALVANKWDGHWVIDVLMLNDNQNLELTFWKLIIKRIPEIYRVN